jgi:uncharacterized membrane protein YesL
MSRINLDPRLRSQLIDTYLDTIPLVTYNVLWFIVSLPIVTIIPATAGLFYVTNKIAHKQPVEWQDFFRGMRRYFWQSWLWGALNLVVAVIFFVNNIYYVANPSALSTIARVVVLMLGVFWVSTQLYMFPLLMEQEKPQLRLALRNSVVIILKRPLFSLRTALLVILIALFTTAFIWPLWMVLIAAYCARVANHATVSSIAKIDGRIPVPESD